MNRFNAHLAAHRRAGVGSVVGRAKLITAGLVAMAAVAGCGTGQIAQTTDQAPAVNGNQAAKDHIALRNVRIQAEQTGDFVQPGSTVDLLFVVSNDSTGSNDELTAISTDIGKVSVTGTKKVPAGSLLIVSAPDGQGSASPSGLKELRAVEGVGAATATVALDKPISNGLTYDFTFEFKKAGPVSLAVPIAAGHAAEAVSQPNR